MNTYLCTSCPKMQPLSIKQPEFGMLEQRDTRMITEKNMRKKKKTSKALPGPFQKSIIYMSANNSS